MTTLGLKDCRPEVLSFALLMERELRANDHKSGWKGDCPDTLAERVEEEAEELRRASIDWMGHVAHSERPLSEAVAEEAADVANMAMMVADVCNALPPAPSIDNGQAAALAGLVDAWESLPGGKFYSMKVIEAWLIDKMAPAVNQARALLGRSVSA
ncbi:hypothetical protein FG93_05521 [Bosea sp. LC85]|uniref:hypothetical protein n=1 Tax=Bosea sp. LC85 TaxID=1502851 RepID=UPI0004E451A4|nr:hypothetical protein [Bosea sp. LC85]KFC64011.1 hypothetical protein FG93_05521 [Bosea sp. LC85]